MNARELWQSIMHYSEFDRMPVIHWKGWQETYERWNGEGLPSFSRESFRGQAPNEEHAYFESVPKWVGVGVQLTLLPEFEEETIEETDEYRTFRDNTGVIKQDWKNKSCIPHYIDFTLKTAEDWDQYKKRLQPDPARIPDNLDEQIQAAEASGLPIAVDTASMMGWIRDWMGVVNMSYLMFDAPDVYEDMVNTLADLTCWGLDQVIPRMSTTPDMGFGWEDICGKTGPLVSPEIFDKYVAQGYRKIRDKLESYGIQLYGIDTDGDINQLIKHWLDAGVNVQFPIEIGTWNADPMAYRQQYGNNLRIIGGLDKLTLEKGREEIDAEIERRLPLMKAGGCVIMPDHLITPGVPLDDYRYYLDRIRELRF